MWKKIIFQRHCWIRREESYFSARRVREKWERGASRKMIVFGLLKRDTNVCTYTEIIPDCSKTTLQGIIRWLERLMDGLVELA